MLDAVAVSVHRWPHNQTHLALLLALLKSPEWRDTLEMDVSEQRKSGPAAMAETTMSASLLDEADGTVNSSVDWMMRATGVAAVRLALYGERVDTGNWQEVCGVACSRAW